MDQRQQLLERRSFLGGTFKAIGLVGASTLFEQQAWAAAFGFSSSDDESFQGALFDAYQMQMLRALTDLILPETATPGGVTLGVHQFLDHQLSACYTEEDQQKTALLLSRLDEQSIEVQKKAFLELSHEQSRAMLRSLENTLGFSDKDKEAFVFTKMLMVFGYFTSEVGATQVLSYQAVPGGFVGSIPYESVGKAWGSVDFY